MFSGGKEGANQHEIGSETKTTGTNIPETTSFPTITFPSGCISKFKDTFHQD